MFNPRREIRPPTNENIALGCWVVALAEVTRGELEASEDAIEARALAYASQKFPQILALVADFKKWFDFEEICK